MNINVNATDFRKDDRLQNNVEDIIELVQGDNHKKGRVIVAKQDIKVGEILVAERAYASILHQSTIDYNADEFCVVCQTNLKNGTCENAEECRFLLENVYLEDKKVYELLFHISDECGVEFSLVLLVHRICKRIEYDSINPLKDYVFVVNDRENKNSSHFCSLFPKLDTRKDLVFSLQTHKEEIYPEHLFLFKKTAERLYQTIFSNSKYIYEEIVVDIFCKIFVNAHSITAWWKCCKGMNNNADNYWKNLVKDLDDTDIKFSIFSNNILQEIGSGLFPVVSMFSHSCKPNCSFMTIGNTCFVQTVKEVSKGEELCISYIDLTNPTHIRRRELWYSKYFLCGCDRCCSDTEENRFVRGYKCSSNADDIQCNGYLMPVYKCNKLEAHNSNLINVDELKEPQIVNQFEKEFEDVTDFDQAFELFENIYYNGGEIENVNQVNSSFDKRESNEDFIQDVLYWKCSSCGRNTGSAHDHTSLQQTERLFIQRMLELSYQLSEDGPVNQKENTRESVIYYLEEMEKMIAELQNMNVHPNHYLLFQMYTKYLAFLLSDNTSSIIDYSTATDKLNLGCEYLQRMIQIANILLPPYHCELFLMNCKLYKLERIIEQYYQNANHYLKMQDLFNKIQVQYEVLLKRLLK
ncbi:hypothetical protein ABK040_007785 [Willaertia magna]